MQADLSVGPVRSRADRAAFLRLPYQLHRDDPTWVPPLMAERRAALDPRRNPYLRRAEVGFWLARRGTRVVGRISAQRDPLVAELRGPGEGHFGMLAAEDDPEVFAGLTGAAEDWLRARGTTHVRGPFSLSINEETGLLVEGRDTPPMLMMGHDLPHHDPRLREQGYAPARDLLAYLMDRSSVEPPAVARLTDRPLPEGVTIRPIRMDAFGAELRALTDIFNDAWRDNWGFVPLTAEETAAMGKQLRPLIDRRLVWFAEVRGEPAAFAVWLPNLNEAIADLGGRLAPFGWARLAWRLKVAGVRSGRVPLMGLRRKYSRGMLGSFLPLRMLNHLRREAIALGYERVELSWVLEDNRAMRRLAEGLGARVYKRYRVYEKRL
ncbi:MAG TPA: N-acetyltransferase [Thermohalobaculum sp.]|nr:N-acetyltransferase [Thermohalobaculum sp.]